MGRSAEQLLAADLSYCCMVVSQQTCHRSLRAFRMPWLCSILLPEMVSRASSDSRSLCPCCWRWQIILIVRSMNNITGPTVARTEPGYKLNCTGRGTLGGVRTYRPCKLPCSICMICWPGRYSQYKHWSVPLIYMAAVVQALIRL